MLNTHQEIEEWKMTDIVSGGEDERTRFPGSTSPRTNICSFIDLALALNTSHPTRTSQVVYWEAVETELHNILIDMQHEPSPNNPKSSIQPRVHA